MHTVGLKLRNFFTNRGVLEPCARFRGLLLQTFRSRWTPWLAVLAQGAVFGVVHVQVGVGLANVVAVFGLRP